MSGHRTARFKCGHPDCREFAHYEIMDRAHSITLQRRYGNGQYRCVRHSQSDSVLSTERRSIVHEMTAAAKGTDTSKLYWGFSGFAHGPGFKAFADDFPAGTVLRVTAEIILPAAFSPTRAPAVRPIDRHEDKEAT